MFQSIRINLEPTPELQELIEDLEIKVKVTKDVLASCGEYANEALILDLKREIKLLESVLGRVVAQQELIDLRAQQIFLN